MNEITQILDTMQARCDGATAGPWSYGNDAVWPVGEDGNSLREVCEFVSPASGKFIAHARTDTPHLIAALREAVKALEGLHEYWNRDPNENAMHDACENTIEVADRTLATIAKLLKGEKP